MGELLTQLLLSFVERARGSFDLLSSAIQQEDSSQVEFLAHGLKGSALNLGANVLGQLCQTLEAQARSGCVEAAEPLQEQIRQELAAVSAVMTAVAGELQASSG